MASTYSQYKIQLIGTGDEAGQWGTITNSNFGSATPGTYRGFEQAIGGRADVTMSGTTTRSHLQILTPLKTQGPCTLNLSGTLSGAADLVVPALQKSYLVKNGTTGGYAVTIKVTGQTGVSIPNGKTVWVYNNGTDVVTAVDHIPSLTLGAALPIASGGTGSTSTTFVNLTTNVTGTLPVANGGTGITSFGTGVATALGQNVTGSGGIALATSPTFVTPVLGTPTSGALTTCTADGTNPVGFKNIPLSGTKTASYTLVAGDVGKFVELGASGTIVIPASVFAAGDAISVFNNTSASIACTCSAITTVYEGGTNTNISATGFSITTRGVVTILFIDTTTVVITGNLA
jgi:hypothetical protein